MNDLAEQMRNDWDARAREDAKFYQICHRRNLDDAEFDRTASEVLPAIRRNYPLLPPGPVRDRRFLEIGCGMGRLMRGLAKDCGEIHGVDISPEMVRLGKAHLAAIRHAHFHVAQGSTLKPFADDSFDLVYSFAVFQHIPDRSAIYSYLDEAFRVLKRGGIIVAQFNSKPHDLPFNTWTGAWIPENTLLSYAKEKGWQVLASEGGQTQYLWLTLKKPESPSPGQSSGTPSQVDITKVRGLRDEHPWCNVFSNLSLFLRQFSLAIHRLIPPRDLIAGGPDGWGVIHAKGLPECFCELPTLSVQVGSVTAPIRRIGPQQNNTVRKLMFQIPATAPVGPQSVTLCWEGRVISHPYATTVRPRPRVTPRVITVTDGQQWLDRRIECDWIQVTLDNATDIATFKASIAGRDFQEISGAVCEDPITQRYKVNLHVPQDLQGRQRVRFWMDGREIHSCVVEIVRNQT